MIRSIDPMILSSYFLMIFRIKIYQYIYIDQNLESFRSEGCPMRQLPLKSAAFSRIATLQADQMVRGDGDGDGVGDGDGDGDGDEAKIIKNVTIAPRQRQPIT